MGSKDDVLLVEEVVVIHPRHARVDSQQNQGQEWAGAANTGAGATNNATNVASDKSVVIEHSGSQAEVAADLWANFERERLARQANRESEAQELGKRQQYFSQGVLIYECTVVNGREEGECRAYYPSGELKYVCHKKQGKMQGLAQHYLENGTLCEEIYFANDQREGVAKEYYPSGVVKEEIPYYNGKEEGVARSYFFTGTLKAEIPFKRGKVEGLIRRYFPDGKTVFEECEQYDGKWQGPHLLYHDNGQLQVVSTMVDSKLHGPVMEFARDGTLLHELTFMRGEPHGIEKTYYDAGPLFLASTFVRGRKEGIENCFNAKGELLFSVSYRQGQILMGQIGLAARDARLKLQLSMKLSGEELRAWSEKKQAPLGVQLAPWTPSDVLMPV